MQKLSINLPLKRRLDLSLVRQRGRLDEPLIPSLTELRRIRRGNKISRYFRRIFEHKRIKKILGSNLALVAIASSFVSTSQAAINQSSLDQTEENLVVSAQNQPLNTEKGVIYPVEVVKINQGYAFYHPGVDLDGETGDPVYPVMAGKVEEIQHSRFAYGNAVLINHGNGIKSFYAHLSEVKAEKGQRVTHESEIGTVGSTGWSTGSHLHLEIIENSRTINPFSVLPRF